MVAGFEQVFYTVSEDDGFVEVCVIIENQLVSDVTVSLQTDSAISGEGYNYIEVLTFVAPSTRECTSVTIINDTLYENDEIFHVRLSTTDTRVQINPNNSQATVQIIDDGSKLRLSWQLQCCM